MSTDEVRPGEIISSEFMNTILRRLDTLEKKVAELDPGGIFSPVQITGFEPPGEVEERKILVIFGTNFLYPPGRNTVKIGSRAVTAFLEGSSSHLKFRVPDMSLPSGGLSVSVLIENALGQATADYKILREKPPVGDPPEIKSVTDKNGNLPLTLGKPAIIEGKNFDKKLDQNIVKLVSQSNENLRRREEIEYPPQGSLAINAHLSNPPGRLAVNLPTIDDVVGGRPPANLPDKISASFKVTVGGHRPVRSDEVQILVK